MEIICTPRLFRNQKVTSTTENIYALAVRTADEIALDALIDILTPKGSLKKLG